jgi:hypothetical protein
MNSGEQPAGSYSGGEKAGSELGQKGTNFRALLMQTLGKS